MTKPLTDGEVVDLDSGIRVRRDGDSEYYVVYAGTARNDRVRIKREDIKTLAELTGFGVLEK